MDTRKPEKCVHKSSNCMAGADSRYCTPDWGQPRTRQKLHAVALPQVARAEPRKDVARILMV